MPLTHAVSDSRAMAGRCLRRSLRDPEAFFTALTLPIVLLLLLSTSSAARSRTKAATSTTSCPG